MRTGNPVKAISIVSWVVVCSVLLASQGLAQPPQSNFVLEIPDLTVEYDSSSGEAAFAVRPIFSQNPMDPIFPQTTQAFSFGVAHDPNFLEITSIDQLEPLAQMNGGAGPDLWAPMLLSNGVTLGVVYSFFGTEFLAFPDPTEVLELGYETNSDTMAGNDDGEFTDLMWSEGLSRVPGGPPVAIVVTAAGETQNSTTDDGTIELTPVSESFVRGDLDGTATVALPDPIFLLNYLFIVGSPEPGCLDAADADDDGATGLPDPLFILNHLFVPGSPSIPFPFPDCGSDPTDDLLVCQTSPAACL